MERLEQQTLLPGTAGVTEGPWMPRVLSWLPQPLVLSAGESKAWEPCKVSRFGGGRGRDSEGVKRSLLEIDDDRVGSSGLPAKTRGRKRAGQ